MLSYEKDLKIYAEGIRFGEGIDLYLQTADAYAVNIVMEKRDPGQMSEPFVRLLPSQAQFLMDQLWFCGFRPTEGTGSAGSLAATQSHLADMRRIVFNQLKIEAK